jgi:hypothetical protein
MGQVSAPRGAAASRLTPVPEPGASRACSILLLYTYGVLQGRECMMDPLRPLPAHADVGCSTDRLGDPCSHIPLSSDEWYSARAERPHTTNRNHARCDGAVPLLDTLEHGFPLRWRDLPARIRYSLKVAGQRQKPRIVKGRGERIFSG